MQGLGGASDSEKAKNKEETAISLVNNDIQRPYFGWCWPAALESIRSIQAIENADRIKAM